VADEVRSVTPCRARRLRSRSRRVAVVTPLLALALVAVGACATAGADSRRAGAAPSARPAAPVAADSAARPREAATARSAGEAPPTPGRSANAPGAGAGYRIYVGTESADAVTVVQGGSWKVLSQIPVGVSPEDIEGVHALAVSPDRKYWYITLAHGFPYGTLWKFTTDGDSLAGRAQLGLFPATIGLTPDGLWAFVVNYNLHGDKAIDTVSAVYTPTMTEVTQIKACTKPHGLDVAKGGAFIAVTCTRDDTLVLIDPRALKELRRGSVRLPEEDAAGKDCYATAVQVMPDGKRAYVSCGHANEVRAVDLETLSVTGRIAECKGAYLMKLDPEAKRLWVPCRSGQDVIVIDTATNEIVGRVATTREFPHTVAFTPDGAYALLTQESKGVVPGAMDVVDRKTLEKVTSVDIGLQATGIGIAPE
jgi:DNA-binding beta-propeller fold protein YncE